MPSFFIFINSLERDGLGIAKCSASVFLLIPILILLLLLFSLYFCIIKNDIFFRIESKARILSFEFNNVILLESIFI